MSDDAVMVDVQAGCTTAFGVLYGRFSDRAQRVARSVCRDDGRAEEAVQEAFASIWKTRASYERRVGTVAPWVLTIVRYRAIDVARRNRPHECHRARAEGMYLLRAHEVVAEQVEQRAQADDLRRLVGLLPEVQREAIALSFYHGLSHAEIAAQLGIPPGTVKGRIRLGLQRLRADAQRLAA